MLPSWFPGRSAPAPPILVNDLVERYRDYFACYRSYKRNYKYLLAWIGREFGDEDARSMTAGRVEQYVTGRRAEGRSPKTIKKELGCLSSLFERAMLDELVDRNPVKRLKVHAPSNIRIRYLLDEEEPILREHCRAHFWRWVRIAICTGMRWGEQFNLRREHINWEGGLIELCRTKNGETRYVPMSEEVLRLMREQADSHKSEWLFPSPQRDHHLCPSAVTRRLKTYLQSSGLPPGLTWHCFRHTAATRMLRAGVDIRTVQHILGHKSLEMTARYLRVCPKLSLEAVEALSRWGRAAPGKAADDTRQ
jgi:integrase